MKQEPKSRVIRTLNPGEAFWLKSVLKVRRHTLLGENPGKRPEDSEDLELERVSDGEANSAGKISKG